MREEGYLSATRVEDRSLVELALGIAPVKSGREPERDRFLLLTLATLVEQQGDGEGGIAVSISQLRLRTQQRTERVRLGLRSLEQQEIITTEVPEPGPGSKRTYRLRRDTLAAMQWDQQLREKDALLLLEPYGLGSRAMTTLSAAKVDTVTGLVALVGRYRSIPEEERPAFATWLDVSTSGTGPKTYQEILDVHDAWVADQD